MKGWVYIISNVSMPGIIKVGYSTKDPELRANELNNTGIPTKYEVEYNILVDEPYELEQKIHKMLNKYSVGKEWFKCTPDTVILAIHDIYKNEIYHEDYKKLNRDNILKKEQNQKNLEVEENTRKNKEKLFEKYESEIREKYKSRIDYSQGHFSWGKFWGILIVITIICATIRDNDTASLITITIIMLCLLIFRKFDIQDTEQYKLLLKKRDEEIRIKKDEIFGKTSPYASSSITNRNNSNREIIHDKITAKEDHKTATSKISKTFIPPPKGLCLLRTMW